MSDQQRPGPWDYTRDDDDPAPGYPAWRPDEATPPAGDNAADAYPGGEPLATWDNLGPGLTGGGSAAWTAPAAGVMGTPPPTAPPLATPPVATPALGGPAPGARPRGSASVPPSARPYDGTGRVSGVARVGGVARVSGVAGVGGVPPENGPREYGSRPPGPYHPGPQFGPQPMPPSGLGPPEFGSPPREFSAFEPVRPAPADPGPPDVVPRGNAFEQGREFIAREFGPPDAVPPAPSNEGPSNLGREGVPRGVATPSTIRASVAPVGPGGLGSTDVVAEGRAGRGRRHKAGPDDAAPPLDQPVVGPRRASHKVRIWMTVNAVVLALIALWVLWPSSQNSTGADRDLVGQSDKQVGSAAPAVQPPTKADVLGEKLPRFGLSTPNSPWSKNEVNTLATAAGIHPTMLQFFVKWTEDFRPEEVSASYDQKALPMLSWEPWAGVKAGECQSAYTLPKIINGSFDAYVTKFATAVAAYKLPIALRFAHEMNGNWYPWSESCPGNHPGDYVKAWRHVHDIFTAVGAANVIWIWSPNIVRPVPGVSIRNLYPGDKYVDWVGMVGYAVYETTAAPVFDPTITLIRKFTNLPLIITETGVQSGPAKVGWIKDFFGWLVKHPDVRGFVWFEYSVAQGGSGDWRFTETAASKAAFHDSITKVQLAGPPSGRTVIATPTASASA